MSELTYKPSESLPNLRIGDLVEILDRKGEVIDTKKVTKIAKRYIKTECGRQWTIDFGEWIAAFHGNKPESYPFPSIRRSGARS